MGRIVSVRSRAWLKEALGTLRDGGILVFPTDTVYGIGCDARNVRALRQLFQMKGRVSAKPFPLLVSDYMMAEKIAYIPEWIQPLPKLLWPGAWTFVFRTRKKLPSYVSRKRSVALRVPNNPHVQKLIARFGNPIVGTSANRSGEHPVRTAKEAMRIFPKVPLVLAAGRTHNKPSTVLDVSGTRARLLRI